MLFFWKPLVRQMPERRFLMPSVALLYCDHTFKHIPLVVGYAAIPFHSLSTL